MLSTFKVKIIRPERVKFFEQKKNELFWAYGHTIKPGTPEHGTPAEQRNIGTVAEQLNITRNTSGTPQNTNGIPTPVEQSRNNGTIQNKEQL